MTAHIVGAINWDEGSSLDTVSKQSMIGRPSEFVTEMLALMNYGQCINLYAANGIVTVYSDGKDNCIVFWVPKVKE